MKIAAVVILLIIVWLLYEAWRTPVFYENEDGTWHTNEPYKKFSDLFKRSKKS